MRCGRGLLWEYPLPGGRGCGPPPTRSAAHEDVKDAGADFDADADAAELDLEDAIRDVDNDLEKYDRKNPGANARLTVYPMGFGEVIEPEGPAQLTTLPGLHVRLDPFAKEPALLGSITALSTAPRK